MTIDQFNFAGKKAFVRVDFNVPLDENFNITDDTRMRAALPTLKKILADGGSVIIGSHLGRPKGPADKFSLKHILKHLEELLGVEVQFANDCMGEEAAVKAAALQPGEVLLLENLRFYAEEEGKPRGLAEDATDEEKKAAKAAVKESQKEFTKKLASYADCYVNDAFGAAHRAHASTAGVAAYLPAYAGMLMEKEVHTLTSMLENPKHPFVAILGGSKVSDKVAVIDALIDKCDTLIIGGGMCFTFLVAQGYSVGTSLMEKDWVERAAAMLKKAQEKGVEILLPSDVVCASEFSNDAKTLHCNVSDIPDDMMGLDIGEETTKAYAKAIAKAKTVFWNGPMGVFEMSSFEAGTKGVALAVAANKEADTIIGGGDSVAAVNKFNLADQMTFISTGGGASMELVQGEALPGVEALK